MTLADLAPLWIAGIGIILATISAYFASRPGPAPTVIDQRGRQFEEQKFIDNYLARLKDWNIALPFLMAGLGLQLLALLMTYLFSISK
jgi:hypothetical protein